MYRNRCWICLHMLQVAPLVTRPEDSRIFGVWSVTGFQQLYVGAMIWIEHPPFTAAPASGTCLDQKGRPSLFSFPSFVDEPTWIFTLAKIHHSFLLWLTSVPTAFKPSSFLDTFSNVETTHHYEASEFTGYQHKLRARYQSPAGDWCASVCPLGAWWLKQGWSNM